MELKDYQVKTLDQIRRYLEQLTAWRKKAQGNPDLEIEFAAKAWEKAQIQRSYIPRKNGIKEPLPNFCLKIPTAGGKTLLAVKTIDLVNTIYRKKRTGLVLWIVPTTQIYRQTIKNLKDREHPYRQSLDIASGGRTIILEKTARFSPVDIQENLAVLMLMLPSASRQNKESLKVFKDSGGFQEFFPPEDNIPANNELLKRIPNLDTYTGKNSFWEHQVKTSLGNTLRLLSPLIILDEGHKAYSEIAQGTLRGFNPCMIVELSATPAAESNILVDIKGRELNAEQMIKLDLHIINKASVDWKETLLASVNHRNILEKKAKEYEANSDVYIRPICLIQAERTGREQRTGDYIHSEDVREYLIKTAGIPAEQIAVKTSEKDELKEVDDAGGLLTRSCPIRYIITKQALQEGWDCPFAYLLTILTNPASKNALTQLLGRILRQPFARKTGIKELDESYVFCFQQKAVSLLASIRKGFEQEGLGDLAGQIVVDADSMDGIPNKKTVEMREEFARSAGRMILPVFVMQKGKEAWPVNYESDIASRISWDDAKLNNVWDLTLSYIEEKDLEQVISLSDKTDREVIRQKSVTQLKEGGIHIDFSFLTRHLLDIVENPWTAHNIGQKVLTHFIKKYDKDLVANNFVFIIEELRKCLAAEKDRLASDIFHKLLASGELRFIVIGKELGFKFPGKIKAAKPYFLHSDGEVPKQSLFEFMSGEDFNETEKSVAWYLETQDKLFFWFRNAAKRDYGLQGWKKHRVYPDFIFTVSKTKSDSDCEAVFVVETKGLHLKNEDTDYKKSLFKLCNKPSATTDLHGLQLAFKDKPVNFEVIFENEWRRKLGDMMKVS